jgi:hypothetical protein
MADQTKFPPRFRVRCKSGDLAGAWLSAMDIYDRGMRVEPLNMVATLQDPTRFTFRPSFIPIESAAYKILNREVADGVVRVLALQGIDAEVTETS